MFFLSNVISFAKIFQTYPKLYLTSKIPNSGTSISSNIHFDHLLGGDCRTGTLDFELWSDSNFVDRDVTMIQNYDGRVRKKLSEPQRYEKILLIEKQKYT